MYDKWRDIYITRKVQKRRSKNINIHLNININIRIQNILKKNRNLNHAYSLLCMIEYVIQGEQEQVPWTRIQSQKAIQGWF